MKLFCIITFRNVKLFFIFSVFLATTLIIIGCDKKEENDDGWSKCYDCTVESWLGKFAGTCDYFNYETNMTYQDLSMTIEIEETAPEYLQVKILVPQYYSSTIYGELINAHMISFAGTSSSVNATLYKNDQNLRLTGNSKKYHYHADTLVLDYVVNFETLKN